ncbi:MAG: DUF6166 domain-containing protein [Gammaproteobacteria bacterium]
MIIEGEIVDGRRYVRANGRVLNPADAMAVNHRRVTEFVWGSQRPGPQQLAVAILLAAGLTVQETLKWSVAFKEQFIAPLQHDAPFRLDLDVMSWVASRWAARDILN